MTSHFSECKPLMETRLASVSPFSRRILLATPDRSDYWACDITNLL